MQDAAPPALPRRAAVPLSGAAHRGDRQHRRRDRGGDLAGRARRAGAPDPRLRQPLHHRARSVCTSRSPAPRCSASWPWGVTAARARRAAPPRRGASVTTERLAGDVATQVEAAVSVAGLRKVFGAGRRDAVEALADIDLVVPRGAFVSLIGPSGCGKSTLLRLVAGLTSPTSGTITVLGKPADRRPRGPRLRHGVPAGRARSTGAPSPATSSCRSSCWAGAARAAADRAREMLQLVELGRLRRPLAGKLSGGMQQRVAIARALVVRAGDAAHGRAVRRARRDDPRAPAERAAAHLGGDWHDGRVRDALDPRGGVPVAPGGGDVAASRAASPHDIAVDLGARSATRARTPAFFARSPRSAKH